MLDRAALNAHAASFAETLYALRRAPVDAAAAGGASRRPLTSRERRRTLAFLVLAPYLRSKMEALYMRNTRPAEAAADWRSAGVAEAGQQGAEGGWAPRVPLPLPPPPPATTTTTTTTASARASSDEGGGSSPLFSAAANRARLTRARQLAVHAFARAYPALAAGLEGARFVYQASYLLGAPVTTSSSSSSSSLSPSSSSSSSLSPSPSSSTSPASSSSSPAFFSPSLHLLRQAVVRVSGPELAEAEAILEPDVVSAAELRGGA